MTATAQPSNANELLPCPFCGGSNVGIRNGPAGHWVACISCGLEAPSESGITSEQAATYWNTRASQPATPTGNEAMAWCGWHPDCGLNFGTMAETQQGATSRLMMTGVAGNHAWSVIPLYAGPQPAQCSADIVELVTDELLAHGEFSSGANNRSNAREAARAVLDIIRGHSGVQTAEPNDQRAADNMRLAQERIADLQYQAGMYKSLYENAVEQCALVAEGTAPVAAGNFFSARRDQCAKIAAKIRSLALSSAGVQNEQARCARCGSTGDTYVLCSGCGSPASAPHPVQSVLRECANRCRYDGDLFHNQGNIQRRDASWKAAEMAEAALASLVPSTNRGSGK